MSGMDQERRAPHGMTRPEAADFFERLTRAARKRSRRRRANRSVAAGISTLAVGAAVVFGVLPLTKLGGPAPGGATPSSAPASHATSTATGTKTASIAFVKAKGGHQHLFVMHADGTHAKQITGGAGDDWGPAWAPGGMKLAFFRCMSDSGYECDIYVVNADGTGLHDLLPGSTNVANPSWSPDGTKIAFTEEGSDGIQIYVMNADGTGIAQLTHVDGGVLHPVWSPDGSKIAFDTPIGSAKGRIGVINPDGSGLLWLVKDAIGRYDVLRTGSWSPDDGSLVFTRFDIRDGTAVSDVFDITLADSRANQLTHDGASEYPSWSPDGSVIAFDTGPGDGHQVYVMKADGTGATRLTHDTADDSNAVWSR